MSTTYHIKPIRPDKRSAFWKPKDSRPEFEPHIVYHQMIGARNSTLVKLLGMNERIVQHTETRKIRAPFLAKGLDL